MEDVCLDRMNAFVKSNIRLYLGMSGWHQLLYFVCEQMLISRKKNPHFVSEVMQRSGGNRLVLAAESSFGSCLAQVLSVFVLCFGCLFAGGCGLLLSWSGWLTAGLLRQRLFSAGRLYKLNKSIAFTALAVINAFRNFPEIVCSGCFEVKTLVFRMSDTFNLLYFEYSSIYSTPSTPGCLSGVIGPGQVAHRACGKMGVVLHNGEVEARGMAFVKLWWLQCVSPGCCHVLHSYHCGFRAGTCKLPDIDNYSPALGASLLVPAGGVWQHPKWLPVGRELWGSSSPSSHHWRKRKPLPKQTVIR